MGLGSLTLDEQQKGTCAVLANPEIKYGNPMTGNQTPQPAEEQQVGIARCHGLPGVFERGVEIGDVRPSTRLPTGETPFALRHFFLPVGEFLSGLSGRGGDWREGSPRCRR